MLQFVSDLRSSQLFSPFKQHQNSVARSRTENPFSKVSAGGQTTPFYRHQTATRAKQCLEELKTIWPQRISLIIANYNIPRTSSLVWTIIPLSSMESSRYLEWRTRLGKLVFEILKRKQQLVVRDLNCLSTDNPMNFKRSSYKRDASYRGRKSIIEHVCR